VSLLLGIDGGGTKTHAVIATPDGAVRGFATNGPSNWEMVGLRGAADSLREAIAKAAAQAGCALTDITSTVFGLAGADWPSDVPRLDSAIEPIGLRGARSIVNDSFIALRAGTPDPWGVVIIAGTGTVAAGRNRDGESYRTLGLGEMLGDWGSASDVSERAITAVANAYTGRGPETVLTERLCRLAGVESAAELLEQFSRGGEQAPSVAPLVLEAAAQGDVAAQEIVERAGYELGSSAALVARRLRLDPGYDLVLAGGLFRSGSALLEGLIVEHAPGARLVRLIAPPVVGAVLMAMELSGSAPGAAVQGRLSMELAGHFSDALVPDRI
jgi:N-acetylglucosamine kinase-like BadF-type ATPase